MNIGARSDGDDAAFPSSASDGFDVMYPSLAALRPHRRREVEEIEATVAVARRLRRDFIDPHALAIEREVMREPSYVARDAIAEAAKHRLFSLVLPRVFGGQGVAFGALTVALEELSAGCVGIANLIAVHGLAICSIAATGDVVAMERVARRLAATEKTGRPTLLSTAITEPSAGTDVEDYELLKTARLVCQATPVKGGYRLDGRKVFISNGSIAQTHVVVMPLDRRDPLRTTFAFLVETGTPGFSLGRVERKMGQKACPAAELVFDGCFVPESARLTGEPLPARMLGLVLGATRGGVAAFAAGVARGALERAVSYAETHKHEARWLIDLQWVQLRLADMWRNVQIARSAFLDALFSNELYGLSSLVSGGPLALAGRFVPRAVLEGDAVKALLTSRRATELVQARLAGLPEWKVGAAAAFGSAAKVTASDLGMANCHLALDLMGADGLRHEQGMEKLYRDAKLLQIYEGTNQLNRIEVFQRGVLARRDSTARALGERRGEGGVDRSTRKAERS